MTLTLTFQIALVISHHGRQYDQYQPFVKLVLRRLLPLWLNAYKLLEMCGALFH